MPKPNPILVELTRGGRVESVHRGAVAVADAAGTLVAALGDVETPAFPRSSLKMVQALPLVETGAADAFGLSDEELALACASHSGEAMHMERVASWLSRLNLGPSDLACGAHPSRHEPTFEAMLCAHAAPTRLHNNCSGKHAGFLTLAKHLGAPVRGYEDRAHPVQEAVAAAVAELAGVADDLPYGIDGCAAPNFALPVAGFARALAQYADPSRQSLARGAAMRRLTGAMTAHPDLVSGTGRTCAILMRAGEGRVAVKTGAEGYYAAIVPERGLGIALKIDDGATRAAETAIATILAGLGVISGAAVDEFTRPAILNFNGTPTGERHATAVLATLVR